MATKITVSRLLMTYPGYLEQVEMFEAVWPEGALVTVQNVLRALALFPLSNIDCIMDTFREEVFDDFLRATNGDKLTKELTECKKVPVEKREDYAKKFVAAWNTGRKKRRSK